MILEIYFKYRDVNYKAISGAKLSRKHISTSKTIQVTCNTRKPKPKHSNSSNGIESWAKIITKSYHKCWDLVALNWHKNHARNFTKH